MINYYIFFFFFSSRRRHTRFSRDWSSDVCSSDLDDVRGLELVELTDLGLRLVAAQWGWTAGIVQKHNTLVGGGSGAKSPARSGLLRHLRHTVEANGIAVDRLMAALRWSQRKGYDNPNATWRSAAACARGSL